MLRTVSHPASSLFSFAIFVSSIALSGCGDAGYAEDTGEETATAGEALRTPGFRPIAPCLSESDYVSRAVVSFWNGAYSPRCLRLASGGTVIFAGSLSEHPLEPRLSGDSFSPIVPARFGGMVEIEFPDPGLFPYQSGADPKQVGVIWASHF